MVSDKPRSVRVDRRTLLIGGGVGAGLLVGWAVWPRGYASNLAALPGETVFGAWLRIAESGQVTVAVPQAELGQGVYTTLPQIIADQLGADWRTVAVEAAPVNPAYSNPPAAETLFGAAFAGVPDAVRDRHFTDAALMLTAGSSSVRRFEPVLQRAGAAARVLLCMAAARRWGVAWEACDTRDGFVIHDKQRVRFAEIAAAAADEALPDDVPLREGEAGRLVGQSLPRLDVPAKVDGSANFAGDIRLPDMVFASIRQGPVGDSKLLSVDRAAADRVPGVLHVVTTDGWVAAVGNNWWAANQALDALAPAFTLRGAVVSSASVGKALDDALAAPGVRIAEAGDIAATFAGARVHAATYRVGAALHAALEPMTATASWREGRLVVWAPTQAPGLARAAAARAIGVSVDSVTLHPMMAGGSFGAKLETLAVEQAAILTRQFGKPVQLMWSRAEDCLHDRYRPPAVARMMARLGPNGSVLGWHAAIAAPSVGRELAARLLPGDALAAVSGLVVRHGDAAAVAGATPFYRLPAYAVDHHPADIGVPVGEWRSGAHSYTAFFTESFLDELARASGIEAFSFRVAMLGGEPRLARCLSTVASLGGWQGGVPGSGQGIACHHFAGSYIAVLAEAHVDEEQRIRVDRLVAAVDCGRMVNPDVVMQQVEGGLMFGMAAALGGATGFSGGLADVRGFGAMGLPVLADTPEISIELIRSDAEPGGVSELAVPPVAPAIANALVAATGVRLRTLPLMAGTA